MSSGEGLCFSDFRIDARNQELWKDAELLAIRPKTFQVLLYLASNSQRLVTREELLRCIWPSAVGPSSLLRSSIWELRQVLGDTANAPRYLETVSRRGYRFLAEVVADSVSSAHGAQPLSAAAPAPSAIEPDSRAARARATGQHRAAAPQPLAVGVLHSLTGTMALSEGPVVDATLLAIDEINRGGGLLGRQLKPLVLDGRSDASVFARQAESLLAEHKVSSIFGCWMSAHRKALLPLLERHEGLLIYPVQYEGLESNPYVFYTGAAPNQQIIPAIRWSLGFLNCRRLFLVGSDYVFPRVAHEIVRDTLAQSGGQIVGEMYIPSGGFEVNHLVESIATTTPDLIVNTINGDSNIAFFRALRARDITPGHIPVLSFSIGENELRNLDIAGNYAAWNYFQSVEREENRRFVDAFRARYGPQRVTSDPMEAAYLGVKMWAQAVTGAGSAAAAEIRAALRHQAFDAPEGQVRIDPDNQHTWKTIRVGRVTDESQFEVIYSSEKPIRPEPYPKSRSVAQWHDFLSSLQRG